MDESIVLDWLMSDVSMEICIYFFLHSCRCGFSVTTVEIVVKSCFT